MAYESKRLKLDPCIVRRPQYLNVDYELDRFLYPQLLGIDTEEPIGGGGTDVRRLTTIDGDGKLEVLWTIAGLSWVHQTIPLSKPITFVGIDGNYYMSGSGWFSKNKGETWTAFSAVSGRSVHGWSWNGAVWYHSEGTKVYVSLNEGTNWWKRHDDPGFPDASYAVSLSGAFAGSMTGWNCAAPISSKFGESWTSKGLGTSSDLGLNWTFNNFDIMQTVLGLNYMGWLASAVGKPLIKEDGSTVLQLMSHLWSTFIFPNPTFTALYRKSGTNWSIPISELFFTGSSSLESVASGSISTTYYSPKDEIAIITFKYGSLYSTERVAYSIDDGITWEELTMPELQNLSGYQFAYWNDTLYISWEHGPLYKTTDWGEEWELVWEDYDVEDDESYGYWETSKCYHVCIGGDTILLRMKVSGGSYVIISKDLGTTWDFVPELTTKGGYGYDLVSDDGTKIVSWCYTNWKDYWKQEESEEAYGYKFRMSSDGGETWTYSNTPYIPTGSTQSYYPPTLYADATLTNIIIVRSVQVTGGTYDYTIWYSPNGGAGWFMLNLPAVVSNLYIVSLKISGDGSTIYAIITSTDDFNARWLCKTEDYGSNWETVIDTSEADYRPTDTLFVSYDGTRIWYKSGYYIIRIVDEVRERIYGRYAEPTYMDEDLENAVAIGETGISCYRYDYQYSVSTSSDENSWINNNYTVSASGATRDLSKIVLGSETGPFAWLIEGWCGAGLIKSISSASYRLPKDINRVSTVLTTANLKKIASQPDNPMDLDDI